MKWIALLVFILVGAGLTLALRQDRRAALVAAFLLGFLPFVTGPWNLLIAPYSFAGWPGYVKGWEVGLIDLVAVACLLGLPRSRHRLPFVHVFLLYIAATTFSVFFAQNFNIALAYPIQLGRVFLVFVAVSRLSSSPMGLKATFQGLFVGIAYQAAVAIFAWLGGAVQTGGSFGHQNQLGFVTHLVFLPAFALILARQWNRWALLGLSSGAIVIVLTVSRGTILFAGVGLTITYLLSVLLRWSPRKAGVALGSLAFLALSYPVIQATFQQRFEVKGGSFTKADEEREAFARAAIMMSSDHPFGVGPNHYVLVANTGGYSQRAGVIWNSGSRGANVHNTYLLVLAESGIIGLISLVVLLMAVIFTTATYAFRNRRLVEAEILVGIAAAFCAIFLHSFYEWVLVTYHSQYLIATSLGVAAGLIRQLPSKHLSAVGQFSGRKPGSRAILTRAVTGTERAAHRPDR